jgi:hypothetical protein
MHQVTHSKMNQATKMIAEVAATQVKRKWKYGGVVFAKIDLDAAIKSQSSNVDTYYAIISHMREWANDILCCNIDSGEDGFPSWTTLVATPAIEKTIDWIEVYQAVMDESVKTRRGTIAMLRAMQEGMD